MRGPSHAAFGSLQYLCGNVPAIDLMQVASNEGGSFELKQDIALLFAASGDLRNIVKTLVGLPQAYAGSYSIVINDKNFTVAARNAMLLLIALYFEPEIAAPLMLHLWYSAMLPDEMTKALQEVVLPCIVDVCMKIQHKPAQSLQAKTFSFGQSSVRLVFKVCEWFELRNMFVIPKGLTAHNARMARQAVTFARQDHIDRALLKMPPGRRAGAIKFRTEGILLPFGACSAKFSNPNP